jgi:hypothetical protein
MRLGSTGPQATRNAGSERVNPAPDGFVGDLDAAIGEDVLDIDS